MSALHFCEGLSRKEQKPGGSAASWPGSAHPARNRPHSFRQNFLECNRLARFSLKQFHKVAFHEANNAFKPFETIAAALLAVTSHATPLHASDSSGDSADAFFFWKKPCGTRSRVILEALFAVDFACGGAYPVGCWGVVQSVGHLTVNEDGGGSNPPAPANSLL
jgi:hypothetical protein